MRGAAIWSSSAWMWVVRCVWVFISVSREEVLVVWLVEVVEGRRIGAAKNLLWKGVSWGFEVGFLEGWGGVGVRGRGTRGIGVLRGGA